VRPRSPIAGLTIPPAAAAKPGKDDVKIEIAKPFKGHRLEPPPAYAYTNQTELLQMYKVMAYYRRFEIVADTMYKQRLIRGFCHLYDGQEAIVTGMDSALKRTDSVITAYRDHCHQLSRGDSGEAVMAELMGKEPGCSRGKGGSMHMYLAKGKFYGGNGIVGAQIPLGAGLAFAHKYKKDGGVAIAAMGDGAANQGQVSRRIRTLHVCTHSQHCAHARMAASSHVLIKHPRRTLCIHMMMSPGHQTSTRSNPSFTRTPSHSRTACTRPHDRMLILSSSMLPPLCLSLYRCTRLRTWPPSGSSR
jgi:hypothetical protein